MIENSSPQMFLPSIDGESDNPTTSSGTGAFGRSCLPATAGRMLIEVESELFTIRPDSVKEIPISDFRACDRSGLLRFKETMRDGPIKFHPRENMVKANGITLEEAASGYPKQYQAIERHYSSSLTGEMGVQTDDGRRILDIRECHFTAELTPHPTFDCEQLETLSEGDIIHNVPIIARHLYQDRYGEEQQFSFVTLLNERKNHSASLVRSHQGELFVVKHLYGETEDATQSYPKTFMSMNSVRQAALDEQLLKQLGEEIGVTPVVSPFRFAAVEVTGLPHREIAFFKMTPYIDDSITLQKALSWHHIPNDAARSAASRIGQYLARLHTSSENIKILHDFTNHKRCVTFSRMHGHLHAGNIVVNRDNPFTLHLLDWNRYTDYNHTGLLFQAQDDLTSCIVSLPTDYREHFKTGYLAEWANKTRELSDIDRQRATEILKKVFSKQFRLT